MNKGEFKLYTASAGSGKTYTLVKEFLILSLSSDNASCKDILAVTFTNKAANEMKVKILFYLDGFVNGDSKCDGMMNDIVKVLNIDKNILIKRSKTLYDNILHNYSDFNISTIDSFVQQVARSFAKELNLPVQYKVLIDDDDLLDGIIQSIDSQIDEDKDAITKILEDFVEFQLDEESSSSVDGSIRVFVRKLLKEDAYRKGEQLTLKEFSGEEYSKIKDTLKNLYVKCKKQLLSDVKAVRDIESEYGIVTGDYYQSSRGLQSILVKIEKDVEVNSSSLCGSIIKGILSGPNEWYAAKGNKAAIAEVNKSVDFVGLYKKIIEDHKQLFYVNIIKKNLYLYALRGTLMSVVNQYIDDTNKVHLSEFNKRISDILGDCSIPFIYEKIGARYKHFFIDEFQDTSLLQWHNFLPLVNNGLSENNMSLLVGDAKQAIYRFRNGEVEQIMNLPDIYGAEVNTFYKECKETFANSLRKESLDSNWRSKKNIIEFNNSFFRLSKHRLPSEEYRNVYDGLEQKCPKKYPYDGFVSVEIFDMEKISADETSKANNKYKDAVKKSILNDIKKLKDEGFSYSDIAILVRSNSDGGDIAEFLSSEKIPVMSSDSITLKSSDKVRFIVFVLKCLLDDRNKTNKFAYSLYKDIISKGYDYCDIPQALKDSDDVSKLYDFINEGYSLYDLCCSIIRKYDINIIEDEFLQYFMNHVWEWQNTENKGIDAFIEHWDKKSDSLNVKIASEIDAVQIMTVHKSKGLEFKVVMYPYAFVSMSNSFKGGEKWIKSDDFELLKDIPEISNFVLPINDGIKGTSFERYLTKEKEKSAFDDFNIMYVAMTRPADLMFIYTKEDEASKDGKKKPNLFVDYFNATKEYLDANGGEVCVGNDDVNLIGDFIKENQNGGTSVKYKLGEIQYHKDAKDNDSKEILELGKDLEDIPHPLEKWTNVLSFEPDPTMFWIDEDDDYKPQEWGNLVHDILSKINTLEDADKVFNYYINEGSIDRHKVEKLRKQFEKIIGEDVIKDAYSKDAVVRNEMDILVYDSVDKKNVILRPDRYAEHGDRVILIDYKTGKEEESHKQQLKKYIEALKGIGVEKNIDAYLVYISKVGENIKPIHVF